MSSRLCSRVDAVVIVVVVAVVVDVVVVIVIVVVVVVGSEVKPWLKNFSEPKRTR